MEQRTLRVLGKGRKERLVPFHEKAAEVLQDYLARRRGPSSPKRACRRPRRCS